MSQLVSPCLPPCIGPYVPVYLYLPVYVCLYLPVGYLLSVFYSSFGLLIGLHLPDSVPVFLCPSHLSVFKTTFTLLVERTDIHTRRP